MRSKRHYRQVRFTEIRNVFALTDVRLKDIIDKLGLAK